MAGNIAKRPNGKWRARYRDEAGNERARHFDRKIDAQRWLDEISSTVMAGTYVDPAAGKITFKRFYDEWAPRQLWVPSTRANADLATGSVTFADLPMKAIRRSHVEAWVKAMSTQWAPSTIKTRFVIVRSVFRAAVADRVISTDPSIGVALPRRRKAEAAMRIPSVDEVGQLLAHADSTRVSTRKGFRAYVALCAFAGLRKGEAAAVQVGDIDFLRRQLAVSRQLQRDGSDYAIRPPKYGSERVVYLPDELVTILGRARRHPPRRRRPDPVALHRRRRADVRQRDHLALARHPQRRQAAARPAPRPAALLRLRPDRRWLRRRHRPARPRPLDRNDHAEHLQPPLAHRRGPHPQGRQRADAAGDEVRRQTLPTHSEGRR